MRDFEHLGNFSAVDPAYSVGMSCNDCCVTWTGCWDNFECPRCGKGELPSFRNFAEVYEPGPERSPLLLRRPAWAGGMTVLAVALAALLSGPIVLGGIVALVELAAVLEPDRP